jgi:hypothetical protein
MEARTSKFQLKVRIYSEGKINSTQEQNPLGLVCWYWLGTWECALS